MDVQVIERELQQLADELIAPGRHECLSCYLERVLRVFGCAGHRFTRRWATGRVRGTPDGLVRWAARRGGLCCDCEVLMNSLRGSTAARRGGVLCAAARRHLDDEAPFTCSGVDGGGRTEQDRPRA